MRLTKIASRRMLLFVIAALLVTPFGIHYFGWNIGLMTGFDAAAAAYLFSCVRLLRIHDPALIRAQAEADDDNRAAILTLASVASMAILAAVASELMRSTLPVIERFPIILLTILLSWKFANMVFALHYAHMHYACPEHQGLDFPGTPSPDYWDFIYFSFTMGVAFATSDVSIRSQAIRRVVIFHCFLAFVFNIGVIGFTINLLAGMHGS